MNLVKDIGIEKENITNAWKEKSVFRAVKAVGLGGVKLQRRTENNR